MAFSRAQWCQDFLVAMGNGKPALDTIDFVVGWSVHETNTNSGAKFNLLNTTQPMNTAGVSDFNSVGVKNYPDYGTGVKANAFTILNGRYAALASALLNNDANALKNPSAQLRANLGTWGTGGGSAQTFIATGAAHRNDLFNYGAAGPLGSLPPEIVSQSGGPENPAVGVPGVDFSWLSPVFVGKVIVGSLLLALGLFMIIKETGIAKTVKSALR